MSKDFKYAHVCPTCLHRETCERNNGNILTCVEYAEDKEYKPKEVAGNE